MSLKKNIPSISTKNMSNREWLNLRLNSIGGSDCGTILGMNPYESQLSLYSIKVGDIEPEDISEKMPVKFGNYLEDFVAECFVDETGKKVRNHNFMMYHPDYPFISANVDKVLVSENAILECKTASEFKKKEWIDGNVPGSYMAQCYHYMLVTGAERVYIAVVFGNSTFQWEVVERDEEIIQSILEQEIEFWNEHVLKNNPPKADGSEASAKALNQLWKETKDNEITFDERQQQLFIKWKAIKQQKARLDCEENEVKNELKEIMGENEIGTTESFRVSWKPQKSKRFDKKTFEKENPELAKKYMKESETRVLRINEL